LCLGHEQAIEGIMVVHPQVENTGGVFSLDGQHRKPRGLYGLQHRVRVDLEFAGADLMLISQMEAALT
jgi:hypothetical protein